MAARSVIDVAVYVPDGEVFAVRRRRVSIAVSDDDSCCVNNIKIVVRRNFV